MRTLAALVVVLGACSSKSDEPIAKRDVPRIDAPHDAKQVDKTEPTVKPPLTVRWSAVTRTDGCFFFSGPDGRDDQVVGDVVVETVEREGASIKLRIGTATFDGTYEAGELTLARNSQYEFGGPWRTTETIRGKLVDGTIVATYGYEECEVASKQCPGRCTVRGTLTFARGL